MTTIVDYLASPHLADPLPLETARSMAGLLGTQVGLSIYPESLTASEGCLYFLGRIPSSDGQTKALGILSRTPVAAFDGETTTLTVEGQSLSFTKAPLSAANAAALRSKLPFLIAKPLGLQKSVGCGDRLGLATPGHLRSVSKFDMAPILTQQSIRENDRTGRTPQEVMDDAVWGVFQAGWRGGFGADADHLKTTEDIDVCAAAGYTFFTIDPSAFVNNVANTAPVSELRTLAEALPWTDLEITYADLKARLTSQPIDLGSLTLTITEEELLRAAVKYGNAVRHTVMMARHLAAVMQERPYELEMSVDETDTVTTLAEHVYVASELKRLGVQCISLAPRYVGEFEKGVDYIGDLAAFEESFAQHLAVSKTFGPYKLSLHSGSDKFSVYPIAARVAGELVHLKTAGTSYLEALRAIASLDPDLFRRIVAFAIERYPTDRASYHVSGELSKVPALSDLADSALGSLLDQFDARQVLHVTFGSVLNNAEFRGPFFETLRRGEETYTRTLETHFDKHIAPFCGG